MTAGAGFGKTTLLAHALMENVLDPRGYDAWVGCHSSDASASNLLGAALRGVRPDGATSPGGVSVDDLCNAVWLRAPLQVCLVFDDVHVIEDGSPGQRALHELAERLPENGHLLLAARRPTGVAAARLLSLDWADELTEDDLGFSDDERDRFAAARGLDSTMLGERGRWPALAELTARAGRGVGEHYVAEEVLSGWTPDDRRVLALWASIGGAHADLAVQIFDRTIDKDQFRRLPLVTVDEDSIIRPHALWAELLATEISQNDMRDLRIAAAKALHRNGQPSVAFELLAAAEAWVEAMPALFDACNDQRRPPWSDVMERWRQLIPNKYSETPEVVYLRGMIARGIDPWSPGAHRDLNRSVLMFQQDGDIVREAAAAVRTSYVAIVRGDAPWYVGRLKRLEHYRAEGLSVAANIALAQTLISLMHADFADAAQAALTIPESEPRLRHFRGYYRCIAALGGGETPPQEWVQEAVEAATIVLPAAGTGWALTLPAIVALVSGRLDRAKTLSHGDLGSRLPISERAPGLCVDALIQAHSGDLAAAADRLALADALLPGPPTRPLADGFRAIAFAAYACAQGDEATAKTALAKGLSAAPHPLTDGLAVLLFPAIAYLLHEPSRAWLDSINHGAQRGPIIDASRALLAAREGRPLVQPPSMAFDPEALAAAFGITLAVEIATRTLPQGRASEVIGTLADRWPGPTRLALRLLEGVPALRRNISFLSNTIPIAASEKVDVEFLGAAVLRRAGQAVDDANWRRLRVRQLLACMVIHRTIRRQRVADLLWPDANEEAASANLRMTLSYVQALLQPDREKGQAPWFLQQAAGLLTLRESDELVVDTWAFDRCVDDAATHRANAHPSAEVELLCQALQLWRGAAFDDVGDLAWIVDERNRLHGRFVSASERASALLLAAGRAQNAIDVAARALAIEPWSEQLHASCIRGYLRLTDQSSAKHAMERYRRSMADLGVAPSPSITALL